MENIILYLVALNLIVTAAALVLLTDKNDKNEIQKHSKR